MTIWRENCGLQSVKKINSIPVKLTELRAVKVTLVLVLTL